MNLKSKLSKMIFSETQRTLCAMLAFLLPILSLLFVFLFEQTPLPLHGIVLSGASSLSFFLFLTHKKIAALPALPSAIAYALSSFTLLSAVYAWEYSVLIALFPLVLLGVEKIAEGRNVFPYLLFLSASLLIADNLSFVTFVASVLWFIYRIVGEAHEKAAIRKSCLRFSIASLCAIFISAFRLFPRLYALDFSLLFTGETTAPAWLIPAKLFPAVYDSILYPASPFLYVGILPLLLLPVFFTAKTVSVRKRIVTAVLFFVFAFTATLPRVSDIYTLLGDTVSFRYGGTLPLIFLMLTLFARGLQSLVTEKSSVFTTAAGVLLTLLTVYHHFNLNLTTETDESYLAFPLFHALWLSVAVIFLYVVLLPLLSRTTCKRSGALTVSVLTLILLTEMTLSASSLLTAAATEADELHRVTSPTYTVRYDGEDALEEDAELYYRSYSIASGRLSSVGTFDAIQGTDEEALQSLLASFGVVKNGDAYEGMHPLLLLLSGVNYTDKYIPYYTKPTSTETKAYKTNIFLSLGTSVKEAALSHVPQKSGDPFHEFTAYINALTGEEFELFESVSENNGVYQTSEPCLLVSVDGRVSVHYGSFINGTSVNASSLSGKSILVSVMNEKECKRALQFFYGHPFDVKSSAVGEVTGNLYTPSGTSVFLTNLPYSEGYRITLDDEAVPAINANGLLAIRVEGGDYHYVSIRYTPAFKANDGALAFGITMTAIFSALTLAWIVLTVLYRKIGVFKGNGILTEILFAEGTP